MQASARLFIMTDPLTDFFQNSASHLQIEVTEDTPLLDQGLLDSLLLMNLIAFLERKYGIEVPDAVVVPENFENLRSIRLLIARLSEQARVS
jgi:acyl carrier protein